MKKYFLFFIAGATPSFLFLVFCFIVAAIGRSICIFNGAICFVRPEWWGKVFGG